MKKWMWVALVILVAYVGVRYIGSTIHYNAVQPAEDTPPPIRLVGDLGFYLTGGSLIPLWNYDTTTVMKVEWDIETTNPDTNEQHIVADVTTLDGKTKRYDLGTAHGCTGTTMNEIQEHKIMFGTIDCYYALSGTQFAAFIQKGHFRIERYDESAKDGSIATTSLVGI